MAAIKLAFLSRSEGDKKLTDGFASTRNCV